MTRNFLNHQWSQLNGCSSSIMKYEFSFNKPTDVKKEQPVLFSSLKLIMNIFQMPHESTVAHEQRFVLETPMISRSRTFSMIDVTEEVCNRHNRVSESTFSYS